MLVLQIVPEIFLLILLILSLCSGVSVVVVYAKTFSGKSKVNVELCFDNITYRDSHGYISPIPQCLAIILSRVVREGVYQGPSF